MIRFFIPIYLVIVILLISLKVFAAGNFAADNFIANKSVQYYDPAGSGFDVKMQAPSLSSAWTFTLPTTAGTANYCLETDGSGNTSWASFQSPLSLGAFGSTPNAAGLSLTGGTLTMQPADATHAGGINSVAQTIAGTKTFSSNLQSPGLSDTGGTNMIARGGGITALYQTDGAPTIVLETYILEDNNGYHTINWNSDLLVDANNGLSVNWLSRLLINPLGTTLFSWSGSAPAFPTLSTGIVGTSSVGVVSNITIGSGLSFTNNTLSATGGSGTVTSVGFSDASTSPIYSISGSPITTSGTISQTLMSQSINSFFAGPSSGSSLQPTFRAIVGADLPKPTATTLGGVESYASVAHQWINSISTSGVPSSTQPAFTDISGTAAVAQTTIANNSLTACTTARTVDWSTGNAFSVSLTNSDTCAITFSNASSGQTIVLDYFQPSGGGTASVSYSTTVKWPGGTTPTMTEGNFATDSCTFKYNGVDYRGSCLQQFQ